jgi:sugar phosphate isomerase/epimerase
MRGQPLLGFSTIGDPQTSLQAAAETVQKFGLQFLELRCLEGTTDLPSRLRDTKLPAFSVNVRVVDTSLCLLNAAPEDVDIFYRFAELAHRLHAPYLRVFGAGGSTASADVPPEKLNAAAELVRRLRATLASNHWECELLLETHDVFSLSNRCLALNARLDVPLRILWDCHHTWRLGAEQPDTTWNSLGSLVAHLHYNDSVSDPAMPDGFSYVRPGDGEYPTKRLSELLQRENYTGGISLEWERLWKTHLPPVSEVLASFRNQFALFPMNSKRPASASVG